MNMTIVAVLAVAVLAVGAFFYVRLIGRQLSIANEAIGQPAIVANAEGFFSSLNARLSGWKTVILAWVAGLAQLAQFVTPDVLQSWQGLPWGSVLDPKVANWISIVCVLLIPVTHAMGVAKAAVTVPVDPGA